MVSGMGLVEKRDSSSGGVLKCSVCGNGLVFDSELQAWVCPCCGVVADDRPMVPGWAPSSPSVVASSFIALSSGGVLARRHVDIIDADVFKRGFNGSRFLKRWVKRIMRYCRDLYLPRSVCFDAAPVFLELAESSGFMLRDEGAAKLAGVAILKVAWDRGIPLAVSRVEKELGVRLFTVLASFGLKPNYDVEAEYAFARVASIVSREFDSVELIAKAREAYVRVLSGAFESRALAAFYYASRALRVPLNISAVCRMLGRNPDSCGNSARALARRYLRVR